ncbi:hypothetical protein [Rhodococcus erythropolis]|uniref:hypothetical protein n=1 Tax=Rhodococcus erythropolis TaxID=1833 RepID=UPI003013EE7F
MKKASIITVATVAAFSMVAVPVASAQSPFGSSSSPAQISQPESRAQALASSASEASVAEYSDRDVAKLLLSGEGPMANSELNGLLGFDENRPKPDPADLEKLLDLYLATVPDFHETVSVPFLSGDPIRVDSALRSISTSYNKFVNDYVGYPGPTDNVEISPQGWFWMGANVAIYANAVGVANAIGYANVGVATLALATIGFVTWYLPGYDSISGIDRDARVAQLANAVSK